MIAGPPVPAVARHRRGTGPTAVAYTLYFRGLRSAPVGTAALLSLLEPLTSTVLAALILGDRLGPAGIMGAVILAMALVLTAVAGQEALSQGTAAGQEALSQGTAAGQEALSRGTAAGQHGGSGDGPADHGRGPAQHHHTQRREHGECLPDGRSAESAGRQHPGGRDRVVLRLQGRLVPGPAAVLAGPGGELRPARPSPGRPGRPLPHRLTGRSALAAPAAVARTGG